MAALKPKARTDLPTVELDGELVIYDEHGKGLHHLNPTATVVYRCFDGQSTVREITDDIAEVSGLPPDRVERQVRRLLKDFREQGLIEGLPIVAEGSPNGQR